jgi:PPM family protein phosphatase
VISLTPRLRAAGVTDRGRVRLTNEDCFGIDLELQLCVIADGMGGHNAGEIASRIAVDAVLEYVRTNTGTAWPFGYDSEMSQRANLLRTAVQFANARIFEAAATSPDWAGMGTTIVVTLVREHVLTVAHVGDSRLYALTAGCAEQLTRDDSWAESMLEQDPTIDPALLRTHPMRNALTSVVGSREQVDVHVSERPVAHDEWLVLTTDGVHGVLAEASLMHACHSAGNDLQTIAAALVRNAIDAGSRDNCTAIVARVDGR